MPSNALLAHRKTRARGWPRERPQCAVSASGTTGGLCPEEDSMFTRPLSMFIFATLHLAACNGDDRRASTGASGVGGGSCGELSTARAPAVPDGLRRPDGA